MKRTNKQQHYVPKSYLYRFGSKKINLFDKEKKEYRKNQPINRVACQDAFYDFSEEERETLKKDFPNLTPQFIENMFSNILETNLKKQLDKIEMAIYQRAEEQVVLSPHFKKSIAIQITYQLFRTKSFRENFSQYVFFDDDKTMNSLSNSTLHKMLLLDVDAINSWSNKLLNMNWIINYNKTELDYYTSDNPVILQDKNTGKTCVETKNIYEFNRLFYPISRKILITIEDSFASAVFNAKELGVLDIEEKYMVNYHNALQYNNAFRNVFFDQEEVSEEVLKIIGESSKSTFTKKQVDELDQLTNEMQEMYLKNNMNQERMQEIIERIKTIEKESMN
ncbi:DUF4238 domain-containing protein [Paenibacillus lautus]|uniref:DUF4238 domain-containing protein n=1 Tax=Paenibacillus lautus TaxID=1401 RepID=UPI001C115E60|nr:DUF4238 domain-containing protein [Paenibacillus lautus]MBU5345801.1 DUF4238 domain-containing protein [Paenibacillus lautus]